LAASPSVRRCRVPRGFTLVELLSVVAIVGTVWALGVPHLHEAIERARVTQAMNDIRSISLNLTSLDTLPDDLSALGPVPLDPWGKPYQYNKFPSGGQVPLGARRDRFVIPINTTFDLYSVGKDAGSAAPLTAQASQDDIIRANDGDYIGLASKY
jgi:general secretion pathway protein G